MGVGVPRPVLVGAVAHRLLVNDHTLSRWNHPDPSETVGAFKGQEGQKSKLLSRKLPFPAAFCSLCNRELVSIVTERQKAFLQRAACSFDLHNNICLSGFVYLILKDRLLFSSVDQNLIICHKAALLFPPFLWRLLFDQMF